MTIEKNRTQVFFKTYLACMRLYIHNNSDKELNCKHHIAKMYKQMKYSTDTNMTYKVKIFYYFPTPKYSVLSTLVL